MRGHALSMGYSLNEHGLYQMNKTEKKAVKGEKVSHIFSDERSIFDFLNMEYKSPEQRIDGRSVVIKGKRPLSLLLHQPESSSLPHPIEAVVAEKKSPKRVTIKKPRKKK